MKVIEVAQDFVSNRVIGHADYEVVSNVKMMNMLSDGLYQDKIRAIIRELSTNAWDSHVMAGNTDVRFEVHLPVGSDRIFKIRDFGTGMTPDKVFKMYRKYGVSDKTDDNQAQGCLGLGSKSPFAYSKQFTSISYVDGRKYIFINAKDERGKPKINLMDSRETNEPNGFEVSFTVNREDMPQFIDRAAKVFRPFPLQPKFTGANVNIGKLSYLLEGTGWGILKNSDYYNKHESRAVMGYVEYPIDVGQFETLGDTQEKIDEKTGKIGSYHGRRVPSWYSTSLGRHVELNKYTALLKQGVVLHFDIGEVEMDISREALQYHEYTVEAIKRRLDIVFDEVKTQIDSMLRNCKNIWEARCTFAKLKVGEFAKLTELYGNSQSVWNGHDISKQARLSNLVGVHALAFTGPALTHRKNVTRRHSINHIPAQGGVRFYVNDVKRGAYAACSRKLLGEGKQNKTLDETCQIIYLITLDDDAAKKAFCEEIGIDEKDLHYISKMPKPPRHKRDTKTESVFEYQHNDNTYLRAYRGRSGTAAWKATKVDVVTNSGVYVEINNWNVLHDTRHKGTDAFIQMMQYLSSMIGTNALPIVYGVKTATIQKFKDSSSWTNIFDWIKQSALDYIKKNNIQKAIALQKEYDDVSPYVYEKLVEGLKSDLTLDIVTFIARYETVGQEAKGIKNSIYAVTTLMEYVFGNLNDVGSYTNPIGYVTLSQEKEALDKKYPMLRHVDFSHRSTSSDLVGAVQTYINLINSHDVSPKPKKESL